MHGVRRKARAINAVVAQHVAIKAVVVPHFLDVVILRELLEDCKHLIHCFLQEGRIMPAIGVTETQNENLVGCSTTFKRCGGPDMTHRLKTMLRRELHLPCSQQTKAKV